MVKGLNPKMKSIDIGGIGGCRVGGCQKDDIRYEQQISQVLHQPGLWKGCQKDDIR